MIAISFRDVLKISNFKGMTEFDLLTPKMDYKVAPFLYQLGIDTEYPFQIDACNHRDLANVAQIGYRYVGDVRIDRAFRSSPFFGLQERLIGAAQTDISLVIEMCKLASGTVNYSAFVDKSDCVEKEELDDCYLEPDYKIKEALIRDLMALVVQVRGELYDGRGNPKLPHQFLDGYVDKTKAVRYRHEKKEIN